MSDWVLGPCGQKNPSRRGDVRFGDAVVCGPIGPRQPCKTSETNCPEVDVTISLPPGGSAGGDLSGDYPNPSVSAIHETLGPTQLVVSGIPDGSYLKRQGGLLVGGTLPGFGNVTGPLASTDSDFAQFSGVSGEVIKDGGYSPASFDPAGSALVAQNVAKAYADSTKLAKSANLSDVSNVVIARTSLGLGTAATRGASDPSQANLSSVSGAITSSHLAVFADGFGTIRDGGAVPTTLPPSGSAGGDLGSTYPNPTVIAIEETSTPSRLTIAGIPNGMFLKRSGTTVIGSTAVTGAAGSSGNLQYNSSGSFAGDPLINTDGLGNITLQGLITAVNGVRNTGKLDLVPVAYPAGGTFSLRFDLGVYAPINLTANLNITTSPGGTIRTGAQHVLDITNTSGGSFTLAWPTGWTWGPGAKPTSIPNGGFYRIWLMSIGTSDSGILACAIDGILASTGVTPGTYGDSTHVGSFTVTSDGRVSAASNIAIAFSGGLPWFNVKSYGALGNGSHDDTSAINAAIAALEATFPNPAVPALPGGVLYFPAGNYLISGVLSTLTGFVQILGDGRGAANLAVTNIQQSSTSAGVFVLTPAIANCGQYIHDMAIWTSTTSGGDAIQFNGSSLLTNCERLFINGFDKGLHQVTGGGATFSSVYTGCNYGIYLENAPNPDVGGCNVQECTLTSTTAGLYCAVDGMTVTETQFGGGQYGIIYQPPSSFGGVDFYIANNHCEALTSAAISIRIPSGQQAGAFQFVGNEFNSEYANSMNCIEFVSGGGTVSGLTVVGNNFQCGSGKKCLSMYGVSLATITGNTFDPNSGTGIYIDSTCSNGYAGSKTNRFTGSGTSITNLGGFDTT